MDSPGTCTVTADQLGSTNYSAAPQATQQFSVGQRPITVTADPQTKTYGDDDPDLTYQVTSGNLIGNDDFNGALDRASGETVAGGPYAITQGTLSLSGNYDLTYVGDDLTIDPRPITVSPDTGQNKVYGASDPTLTFHLANGSSLGFSSETLTGATTGITSGALSRDPGEDVGTYLITGGTLSANSNYDLTFDNSDDVTFEITPKAITITPKTGQSKYYGQSDPTLDYTPSPALESGDNFIGALDRAVGEDV